MLSAGQNFVIVLLVVGASLAFMAGLNKVWPWEKRRDHNDLTGWQIHHRLIVHFKFIRLQSLAKRLLEQESVDDAGIKGT